MKTEQNIFSAGIFQNYLVCLPAVKCVKYFRSTNSIYSWKFNGMSEESLENVTKLDSNFALTFVDHHFLPDINFNVNCLIKNHIFIPKRVINLQICQTLGSQLRSFKIDFTLSNCLFGYVKPTKNADLDKYTSYGIGFDYHEECSLPDERISKNVIIFKWV